MPTSARCLSSLVTGHRVPIPIADPAGLDYRPHMLNGLMDHLGPLGVPAFHGAMIGHVSRQFTLPLGIEVELDASAGTLRMLESAVS